jgi:hypothetical protein
MDNPYLGDGRTCYPIAESQPAAQRLHGGPKLDAKGVDAKAGREPGFRLTPNSGKRRFGKTGCRR